MLFFYFVEKLKNVPHCITNNYNHTSQGLTLQGKILFITAKNKILKF